MKTYSSKIIIFLLLISFFIPVSVEGVRIENPLEYETFQELLSRLIDFIFYLAVGIAPIMIIVAGFHFITAAGEPEKINTAKKIILWTLIGLIIVFSAKGLVELFGKIFEVDVVPKSK